MDRIALEHFIRETLGCGCPDEVFRDLRFEPSDGLHDGAIHVGGRLLVFLLRGESIRRLPALIKAGRQRRDVQGYTRVRFVVLTEEPQPAAEAERLFHGSSMRDERTHLHLVAAQSLASLGI